MPKKDKISVCGYSIPVVIVDPSEMKEDHADYLVVSATPLRGPMIRINKETTVPYYECLWHEGLHAIMDLTGLSNLLTDEQEEAIVTAFELHGLRLAQECLKRK